LNIPNPIDSIECLIPGGAWSQIGQDIDGKAANDQSGCAVAMSNDGRTIVIGAPYNGGNGVNAGLIHVYALNTTLKSWVQLGADINGRNVNDQLGFSVAMSGDGKIIAIGSPFSINNNGVNAGHVRVYAYNTISNVWTQLGSDINGNNSGDRSGTSVALSRSGGTVVIGEPFNDNSNGTNAGLVHVYACILYKHINLDAARCRNIW
jgi:hypothetical protein